MSRVGLGAANGRHFLFHAGVGFDAAVVEQVERNSDLKRYLSHPLFAYKAVMTWLRHYDREKPHFRIDFPDGTSIDDGYFMVALNTNPYTYLGSIPFDIAPDAGLDRALAAVTIRSLRADHLLRVAASALLANPRLAASGQVDHRSDLADLYGVGRRAISVAARR